MIRTLLALYPLLNLFACTLVQAPGEDQVLKETAILVEEVKQFGKTVGIEPTAALRQTTQESQALSMLWFWLQRAGTLALRTPIDVRMAMGFSTVKEKLPLEQVYRVDGYSVYYRQGNEFADERSVATIGFADEPIVRRVKVVLHEDLHGDQNFALTWDVEESVITPLGSLAAVKFFEHKGDSENARKALDSLEEERKVARELNDLVKEAERIFRTDPVEEAKRKVLAAMASFPTYHRQFQRQIRGQHPPTALEAKLSHDLAYYKYFDWIVALYEKSGDLRALIEDLKKLPRDAGSETVKEHLRQLNAKYSAR